MSGDPFERMICWYPPQWRTRYGGELVVLLEDTYVTAGEVPIRDRLGLARAGLAERARVAGLMDSAHGPDERLRAGSVLVLCGWALFLVASAIFGKFSDNWLAGTPWSGRFIAGSGLHALAAAAVLGCGIVVVAALCALPASLRLLRGAQRSALIRSIRRASCPLVSRRSSWEAAWRGPTT